jgi:hypothetical protein
MTVVDLRGNISGVQRRESGSANVCRPSGSTGGRHVWRWMALDGAVR